jgi:hypothetical protein
MNHRSKYLLVTMVHATTAWWSGCTPESNLPAPVETATPKPLPPSYEAIALTVPSTGQDGFRQKLPIETGFQFTNTLNTTINENDFDLLNGSGVALEDFDKDGLCDIYFAAMSGKNKLFRNLGNWRFQDVTESVGLPVSIPYSSGAVFEDVDGDSYPDLLVSVFGSGVKMFQNQQNGRFTDVTQNHLQTQTGSASLALADVDGDRDLDLYVVNYGVHTMRTKLDLRVRTVRGQPQVVGRYRDYYKIIDGKLVEYGEPDTLYLNDGSGRFEPVSWTKGTFKDEQGTPLQHTFHDLGLSAMFRDMNHDGLPDLYVCNDFQTPDRCWINLGRGTFQLIDRTALKRSSYSSMGVDFADINRDGLDDFLVVDMLSRDHKLRMTQQNEPIPSITITGETKADRPQVSRNTFFLNEGNGHYEEVAHYAGLYASEWAWCPVFLDVDLDGYEDVLIVNGHAQDNMDRDTLQKRKQFPNFSPEQLAVTFPELKTPNLAFRNQGDIRFKEVGEQWGFNSNQVSNAIALADLDNDGDLDAVLNCLDAPALIYENTSIKPRIAVKLIGKSKNARGIGSRIVYREGSFSQSQEIVSGGRYLSGDQAIRTFAIIEPDGNGTIEVFWRSGAHTLIEKVKPNHLYQITEPGLVDLPNGEQSQTNSSPTWFKDVTDQIKVPMTDLRPEKTPGATKLQDIRASVTPRIIWADMDNDGDDDLLISGQSNATQWLENDGSGNFAVAHAPDQISELTLYSPLVSFQHPNGTTGALAIRQAFSPIPGDHLVHWHSDTRLDFVSVEIPKATTLIKVGDYTGDNLPDIYLSNHSPTTPLQNPSASLLLKATDGGYQWDQTNQPALDKIQRATDAEWIDWDLDGDLDLLVACKWGSLEFLLNEHGIFTRYTEEMGFHDLKGIWLSLGTGDFDENGRPDIIACNLGSNTPWAQWGNGPFRIYIPGTNDNTIHLTLAGYNKNEQWWPISSMEEAMPWLSLTERTIASHQAYADLTMDNILEDMEGPSQHFEINTLETGVLLNLPDSYVWHPLPARAQWAPATGTAIADFNLDGHLDIFLSQNWDYENTQWAPMTSGKGLLLSGDGTGQWTPIKPNASGINLTGQQSSPGVTDFNQDEKPDFVVYDTNHGIRLFENQSPFPETKQELTQRQGTK